ncbi:MAG: hypothetical protein AB7F94_07105 [Nitrospira sp.]
MISKIFVNLPVKDLSKSMDFFKTIGFSFNPGQNEEVALTVRISSDRQCQNMRATHG